jgi:hypothetical protein
VGRTHLDLAALAHAQGDRKAAAAHRDEARRVVEYQADDAHLFTDRSVARGPRTPSRQERTA